MTIKKCCNDCGCDTHRNSPTKKSYSLEGKANTNHYYGISNDDKFAVIQINEVLESKESLLLEFVSYDENAKHLFFNEFLGHNVRLTIEVID